MPLGDSPGESEATAGDARDCLRCRPDSDPEIGIARSLTEGAAGEQRAASGRAGLETRAMKKTNPRPKFVPFDAARYLTDDAAIAEYMTAVLETGDSNFFLLALGDIARARGMSQVAKDAGLGRESLYKALAPGAKPRFDTVLKVARALGVRLTAQPT